MLLNAEQKCMLWLSSAEVTAGHVQKLREYYGNLEEVWERFGKDPELDFSPAVQAALEASHSREFIDGLTERLEEKSVRLLFREDPAYPSMLAAIQDPPYLLYYAGKLACLEKPMMALVGTRRASSYGCEMASMLATGLAEAGVCVVSGLARGIDAAAHEAAVKVGGRTVGVLGSGINVPYPSENTPLLRQIAGGIGLILSEYPLDAPPRAFHFPHRNRIISGLSMGVVFVEGRIRSGGMHTVHAALSQGREVFAVPGRVGSYGSEGPHAILREGARIVTSAAELLDDLGLTQPCPPKTSRKSKVRFTPEQQTLINLLHIESATPQELAQKANLKVADVITELGTLEILGAVSRQAGNRFYLPLSAKE